MGVNDSIPNIPKLLMVNVPPISSSGVNLFIFALSPRSFNSLEISFKPFTFENLTTGTKSPVGTATATPIFT